MVGFSGFSLNATWAQSKIKQFHALAPVAFLGNTTSPIKYIALTANSLSYMLDLLGQGEFLPTNALTQLMSAAVCSQPTSITCESVMFMICGYDYQNLNRSRDSVFTTHAPAGTSAYNIAHFAQLIQKKKFQAMDWGAVQNLLSYSSWNPPQYQPNLMTVPTALYWGDKDILAHPLDVARIQPLIRNLLGSYQYPDMDHIDFVWGLNAALGPYQQLMQTIAADVAASAAGR